MHEFEIRRSPPITNDELDDLCALAWGTRRERDFERILGHSLAYFCARSGDRLVGFVNVAWDGGLHAFLLDPTVHPDFQRRGLGLALLEHAEEAARAAGAEWLHVDFEPELEPFYRAAGYRPTAAGLLRLRGPDAT